MTEWTIQEKHNTYNVKGHGYNFQLTNKYDAKKLCTLLNNNNTVLKHLQNIKHELNELEEMIQ